MQSRQTQQPRTRRRQPAEMDGEKLAAYSALTAYERWIVVAFSLCPAAAYSKMVELAPDRQQLVRIAAFGVPKGHPDFQEHTERLVTLRLSETGLPSIVLS